MTKRVGQWRSVVLQKSHGTVFACEKRVALWVVWLACAKEKKKRKFVKKEKKRRGNILIFFSLNKLSDNYININIIEWIELSQKWSDYNSGLFLDSIHIFHTYDVNSI